ncbi:MAG TPA: hypothetical protein VFB27_12535 [Opitutaceae bacterium]|nr:hypothetical protein [Opitutaceae bacterium]
MRYTGIVLLAFLSGCMGHFDAGSGARPVTRSASVLYLGMPFDQADEKLREYGAEPTMFEVALTPEAYRKGMQIHYYHLTSGVFIEIRSKPGGSARVVASISVSAYVPKSWDSIDDPERMKFFDSFKNCEEYDLRKEPNKAPEPTPTAVTPRADARVAPAARVAHL